MVPVCSPFSESRGERAASLPSTRSQHYLHDGNDDIGDDDDGYHDDFIDDDDDGAQG